MGRLMASKARALALGRSIPQLFVFIVFAMGAVVRAGAQDAPGALLPSRPLGTPDVVVLGFAGCFTGIGFLSASGLYGLSGSALVMDSFITLGKSVQWREYAPAMGDHHISPIFLSEQYGLEHAVSDVEWIEKNWIQGFSNPTRLVLISASCGGPNVHVFPFLFPELQFDYLIDVDTMCALFTTEYLMWAPFVSPERRQILRRRFHEAGHAIPLIMGVPSPCAIGPGHPRPIANLVAENVVYNLDIRTAAFSSLRGRWSILPGLTIPIPTSGLVGGASFNIRPFSLDGKPRRGEAAGIYRYVDTTSWHAQFDASSDGARWAAAKILELGLPPWRPRQADSGAAVMLEEGIAGAKP
jgi:hypothetical protein